MLEGAGPDAVSFGAEESLRVCLRLTKLPRSDSRATAALMRVRNRQARHCWDDPVIYRRRCPERWSADDFRGGDG